MPNYALILFSCQNDHGSRPSEVSEAADEKGLSWLNASPSWEVGAGAQCLARSPESYLHIFYLRGEQPEGEDLQMRRCLGVRRKILAVQVRLLPSSPTEPLPGRLQGQGQVGDMTSTLTATASERRQE